MPGGHWKTTAFVAALRCDAITAPFVKNRPINCQRRSKKGPASRCKMGPAVGWCLSPSSTGGTRARRGVPIHETDAAARVGGACGPTGASGSEVVFSKTKAFLRKAAERTVDALWDTIGQTLDTFTPQECVNYFKHAGYA